MIDFLDVGSISDELTLFFKVNQELSNFISKDSLRKVNDLFFFEHGFSAESINYYNRLGLRQLEYVNNDNILFRECSACKRIQLFGLWGDWSVYNARKTSGFCSPKCMHESSGIPLSECKQIFKESEIHFLLDVY